MQSLLPRQRDKVAIVGFAKPHRDLAPFGDPEWEIWSCNDAWSWLPKGTATRWFDMHSPEIYEWGFRRSAGHLDWLKSFEGQIYFHEARADVPNSVAYPLDAVIRNIGAPYLTSSIAYMQGLALLLGFKHIGVWGIDMNHDSEYADQRPCCELLLGVALARGIKIEIPEASPLMRGPLYGRGYLTDKGDAISHGQMERRYTLLCERQALLTGQCDEIMAARKQIDGAVTLLRKLFGVMPDKGNELKARLEEYERQTKDGERAWAEHKAELDRVRGMVEEAKYWIGLTPEGQSPDALLRDPDQTAPMLESTRGGALA